MGSKEKPVDCGLGLGEGFMNPGSIPLELFKITFHLEEALGRIHWRDSTSHLGAPQGQMSHLISLQYK